MADKEQKEVLMVDTKKEPETITGATWKQGFASLKSAWRTSAGVKICFLILAVVAVLFLIFFILMIAMNSSKSTANQEQEAAQVKLKVCNADLSKSKAALEECRRDVENKEREIRELNVQIETAKKDLEKVQKEVKDTKALYDTCKSDLENCKSGSESLTRQINECSNEKRNLENQIEQIKKSIHQKDLEIKAIKDKSFYYEIGLIGSAIVHVGVIIKDIYTHSERNQCTTKLQHCHTQYENCSKHLNVCKTEEHHLRENITKIDKELKQCDNEKEECTVSYVKCIEIKRKLEIENEELHVEINKMPLIAVEEALLHELLKEANYTYYSSLKYTGSIDGFNKNALVNRFSNSQKTVIVGRTKNGLVFGGYLTIRWQTSGGWQTDNASFIFDATPFSKCESPQGRAVNFDAPFIEMGEGFVIEPGVKTAVGHYECKNPQVERLDFEIVELFGFEVFLNKKS